MEECRTEAEEFLYLCDGLFCCIGIVIQGHPKNVPFRCITAPRPLSKVTKPVTTQMVTLVPRVSLVLNWGQVATDDSLDSTLNKVSTNTIN